MHNLPFDVQLGMQVRVRLLDVLVDVVEGLRLEAPLLVADGRDLGCNSIDILDGLNLRLNPCLNRRPIRRLPKPRP